MQINFLGNDQKERNKKEKRNNLVEEIKFSEVSPKKDEDLLDRGKEKSSSFFKNVLNYFKKDKKHPVHSEKNDFQKSRMEMLNLINKEKKIKTQPLEKPFHPRHNNNFHKVIKKIEKKEESKKENKRSILNSIFNFFKPKPKNNIAPEFITKEQDTEKKIFTDIKKPEQIEIKREEKKITEIENPGVLESNLIKEESEPEVDWSRNITFLAIFIILALAILGFSYWGLGLWGNKKIEASKIVTEDVKNLSQEVKIARENASEAIKFKDKLSLINSMLDNHVYWTNFFKFLEDNTLQEVYYSGNFQGDIEGQYNLTANTKSYGLIEAQIEQFNKNPYVASAEANNGELYVDKENDLRSVQFDLGLIIKPSLFVEINN